MNKEDFKIFENYKKENIDSKNNELIYLDSAASSLTPDIVVEKMNEYYFNYRSNIDRGLYKNATRATGEYDEVRKKVAKFFGAEDTEIIWTASATDGSNKLMYMLDGYLKNKIASGKNEIVVSEVAHHSDVVALQEFAKRNNLEIKTGFENINEKTLIVSHMLVSNVTGEIFDVKNIFTKSKEVDAFTICDITSAAGHIDVNLHELDMDAAYFSAHKMCGPTGVGVLYIKNKYLNFMSPSTFGGGMVFEVNLEKSNYRSDIKKHEAGTANIAGVIGFGEAINYLENIGIKNIENHVKDLMIYAFEKLQKLEDENKIKIFFEENEKIEGNKYKNLEEKVNNNVGIISFEVYKNEEEGDVGRKIIHPHDVAQILADNGVAVRSGHHCAQLLMKKFCVPALTRASIYFYNDKNDIDKLIVGIEKVFKVFGK